MVFSIADNALAFGLCITSNLNCYWPHPHALNCVISCKCNPTITWCTLCTILIGTLTEWPPFWLMMLRQLSMLPNKIQLQMNRKINLPYWYLVWDKPGHKAVCIPGFKQIHCLCSANTDILCYFKLRRVYLLTVSLHIYRPTLNLLVKDQLVCMAWQAVCLTEESLKSLWLNSSMKYTLSTEKNIVECTWCSDYFYRYFNTYPYYCMKSVACE